MQNSHEQFQSKVARQESLRFQGQAAYSQIRAFMDGRPVQHSTVLDNFVWLIGGGYKKILISGEVPESLVNRMERPAASLEKFFSDYLQYFFRQDFDRPKLEELYVKFTNQMTAEDVKIVYAATLGEINLDPDHLERYAGNRRFANGALIFRRDEYVAFKSQEKKAAPAKPVEVSESASQANSGHDPLSIDSLEDEVDAVDNVAPATPARRKPAVDKSKAKVAAPKKERPVRKTRTPKASS
uniref:Uncharacterized protein n=1 Tax=Rhizobium phage LG08 TaxID=3129229 RepID=A0AAU8HXT9_9CAUD